jgi:hypothetical protein
MIDHYYAPISDGQKEMPYDIALCEHVFFSTGPIETVELENDNMTITVSQSSKYRNVTNITAGPFIFPIIPTFPINWFQSEHDQFVVLKLIVKTKNDANIKWNIRKTEIIMPDNNRIQPVTYFSYYQGRKADLPVDEAILKLQSRGYFELRYPLTAKTNPAFSLSLQGFSTDDKSIVLPDVKFQKASSWKMCGAP